MRSTRIAAHSRKRWRYIHPCKKEVGLQSGGNRKQPKTSVETGKTLPRNTFY